jgi:hypothetical protein
MLDSQKDPLYSAANLPTLHKSDLNINIMSSQVPNMPFFKKVLLQYEQVVEKSSTVFLGKWFVM